MRSLVQTVVNSFANRRRPFAAELWFANYFRGKNRIRGGDAARLVVVESVEDIYFYSVLGEIVTALRGVQSVRVGRWASRSLNPGASLSLRGFLAGRMDSLVLSRLRWKSLYDAFCDEAGDRADALRAPWHELSFLWRAWRLFRGLESKDQLAALEFRGIPIGDLVIDSYLRFRPAVEIDIRDRYLFVVLRQAVKDVAGAQAYFRRVRPALYLSTYATYLQHGIPARVAVALGIPAWSFANAQQLGTRLTRDHLLHTKPCSAYSADFAKLPDPGKKIAEAAAYLGGRTGGVADTATANQHSAYVIKTPDVPDVCGAAVVFLHDFYDSAHIYRWMVFHDFWEWACTTIEVLRDTGLPFFVKPHPNQRAESNAELNRLKRKYPDVKFISPDISNRQLVDAGMACAITVYGSVAAEMAYLGVPSITCGDNPHASFDAFPLAKNKAEYRSLLRNFPSLPRDPERLKLQACAFYYMHNLNIEPEARDLRDRMIAFYLAVIKLDAPERPFSSSDIGRLFADMNDTPGFRHFIAGLAAELKRAAPG
jgi:hypothetical protein